MQCLPLREVKDFCVRLLNPLVTVEKFKEENTAEEAAFTGPCAAASSDNKGVTSQRFDIWV